ncbi:MAG TPA: hypothetical protein VMT34_11370 [Aggregatilineales bacterium]|nr:hypothetical protein [Aggregatilineales bacterium]
MDEPEIQVFLRGPSRRPTLTRGRRRSLAGYLFLLLVVILVLLGLANLAILGLQTLNRPTKPASGELLYASTFDAYNDEWTQRLEGEDHFEIANNMLVLTIDKGGFSQLDRQLSDFDLRFNAIRLSQPDDVNEMGALFRVQDVNHYYMFRIRGDGAYRVEVCQDCKPGEIDVLSEWQYSPAILIGINQVNELRIVAQGDQFRFYANGQLLKICPKGSDRHSTWTGLRTGQCMSNNGQTADELIDGTFAYGKIGMGLTTTTPGVQIGFTNVLIYGP